MKTMEQRRMTYLEARRDMREGSHIHTWRHGVMVSVSSKQAMNGQDGWMDRIGQRRRLWSFVIHVISCLHHSGLGFNKYALSIPVHGMDWDQWEDGWELFL
jgi:hypothetical protein